MKNKKAIITGVTGQDGSFMADFLLENTDIEVIGGIRRTSQQIDSNISNLKNNPRFKLAPFDLNDVHSVSSLIKNIKPDYFINFGAQTFVADSWNSPINHFSTNALGVLHILEAIKEYSPHTKFYSAGSTEQWGDVISEIQDIDHPMRPRSVYGVSKCAAALLTKVYRESYGLYAVHCILANHESERRQKYFVTRKITSEVARIKNSIDKGESFEPLELGNLDARRDWSHAKDFVEGIWRILHQEDYRKDLKEELPDVNDLNRNKFYSNKIKDYVLSSGETHSVREFVEKAFTLAGIDFRWSGKGKDEKLIYFVDLKHANIPLVVINPKFYRPADVELLWGDSTPARKELGWSPKISFNQLVEKMVKADIA